MCRRQVEHSARAIEDGLEQKSRLFGGPRAGIGSGMDHKLQVAVREGKAANIAMQQLYGRVVGEMWLPFSEALWRAREHHHRRAQRERAIRIKKALQQPAAKESRTAGEEDTPAPQLLPHRRSLVEDRVQISLGNFPGYHRKFILRSNIVDCGLLARGNLVLPQPLR